MMPDIDAKAIVSVFDAGLKDVACRHAVYGQGFEPASAQAPAFVKDLESGTQSGRYPLPPFQIQAALGTPPAIGFVESGDRSHGLNITLPVAVAATGIQGGPRRE